MNLQNCLRMTRKMKKYILMSTFHPIVICISLDIASAIYIDVTVLTLFLKSQTILQIFQKWQIRNFAYDL